MSMTTHPGRSYRYFTGVPLWPFGYGLSYTQFSLQKTQTSDADVALTMHTKQLRAEPASFKVDDTLA